MPTADPARLRAWILIRGRQILEECARKERGPRDLKPSDVLEDIADAYAYEPWDVALVGVLVARLHPRTRVPQALRAETARIAAERHRLVQALRSFGKKFMARGRPVVSCVQVVLAPRPGVGHVYTTGRPSQWILDEFAGAIRAILGQARVPGLKHRLRDPIATGFAFSYGKDLLSSLGIRVMRRSLEERARALSDLPPEPNDQDPLGWADAIARRLGRVPEGDAILRRLLVPETLPLETFRYRMTASSPDIVVRRFTRKALPKKP